MCKSNTQFESNAVLTMKCSIFNAISNALLCRVNESGTKELINSKHKRLLIETSIQKYYNTNDRRSLTIDLQMIFLDTFNFSIQFARGACLLVSS